VGKISPYLNLTLFRGNQIVNPAEHLLDPRRLVPPADINRFKEEAIAFNTYLKDFDKEFNETATDFFYVISNKWLTLWKHNVSYKEFAGGEEPDLTYLGQINLPILNEDIVVENSRLIKYSDREHYCNVVVKPYLQYGIDYVLVTENAWRSIVEKYPDAITIKRPAYTQADGNRKVEVYIKQVFSNQS
jgi:DUSP domain